MRTYKASLQQDGTTSAPTVVEMPGSSWGGNIVWTRWATGEYIGTLTGAFPNTSTERTFTYAQLFPGEYDTECLCSFQRDNDDRVILNVLESDGATRVDGCKVNLIIEIHD